MFGIDQPFEIRPFYDRVDRSDGVRVAVDAALLRQWLASCVRDPFARVELCRALDGVERLWGPLSDEQLIAAVTRSVARGLLEVRPSRALRAPPPLLPVAAPVEEAPAPHDEREEVGVHWVEVALVGEDRAPIGGVAYRLTDPDGRVHRGRLDDRGLARVSGIRSAGACTLTFDGLDQDAWGPA